MNDYIDRLIGRSLNKSPVIQPRLPSIFEPQRNDETVHLNREVDNEPTYHSSQKYVLIKPQLDEDKQISSADTVIKRIKTGKNDRSSHTSDQSEFGTRKGLTALNKIDFEESTSSLDFAQAKKGYTDEFIDLKKEISFQPENKHTENLEIIKPPNLPNHTIETESRTEESISKRVATYYPQYESPEKISEQVDSSHSTKNEMIILQHKEKTKSRSDHRLFGKLNHNSDVEDDKPALNPSQRYLDVKNGLENTNNPESANGPFKGKLVTGSGFQWNNKTSVINDNREQQDSIIRVHIGRIEVRAVQPPTSPPKPQRKQFKPILSLDDYLNQRNGG